MMATELVEQLMNLIDEHGDREIFSEADYEFVRAIEVDEGKREKPVMPGSKITEMVQCFTLVA